MGWQKPVILGLAALALTGAAVWALLVATRPAFSTDPAAGTPGPDVQIASNDPVCDGVADVLDAQAILRMEAGLIVPPSCGNTADVNDDGVINSVDTILVLQYIVQLIPSLPNGAIGAPGVSTPKSSVNATAQLLVESAGTQPNGTAEVDVRLGTLGAQVGAYTVDLHYDASLLTATGCISLSIGVCNQVYGPGVVRMAGVTGYGFTLGVSSTIATVTFQAGATEAITPLDMQAVQIVDETGRDITPSLATVDGQFSVLGPPTVAVGSLTLGEGSEGSVDVQAIDMPAPGLNQWTINVSYDPSIVMPVSCTPHLISYCLLDPQPGIVQTTGATMLPEGLIGTNTLATFALRCLSTGNSPLTVAIEVLTDASIGPQPIPAVPQNGSITCGAAGPAISIGSLSLAVGAQGSVDLMALNMAPPGLGIWTVDVSHPSFVSIPACDGGSANSVCNTAFAFQTVRVVGADSGGLVGNTQLAGFTFRCDTAGSGPFALSIVVLADATLGNPQNISATLQAGTITCSSGPLPTLPSTGGGFSFTGLWDISLEGDITDTCQANFTQSGADLSAGWQCDLYGSGTFVGTVTIDGAGVHFELTGDLAGMATEAHGDVASDGNSAAGTWTAPDFGTSGTFTATRAGTPQSPATVTRTGTRTRTPTPSRTPSRTPTRPRAATATPTRSSFAHTLRADSSSARVGSQVSIDVVLFGMSPPGLGAWTIDLRYNSRILSPAHCGFVGGSVCDATFLPSVVRSTGASAEGLVGDVPIATMVFVCQTAGSSDITLEVQVLADATVGNPQDILDTVRVENGRVTCIAPSTSTPTPAPLAPSPSPTPYVAPPTVTLGEVAAPTPEVPPPPEAVPASPTAAAVSSPTAAANASPTRKPPLTSQAAGSTASPPTTPSPTEEPSPTNEPPSAPDQLGPTAGLRSETTSALRAPDTIFRHPEVVGTNVLFAIAFLLALLFASHLFNETLDENRREIESFMVSLLAPLRRLGGAADSLWRLAAGRRLWLDQFVGPLILLLLTGVIYSVNEPDFGFNKKSLVLGVSVVIAIAAITGVYEWGQAEIARRRLRIDTAVKLFPVAAAIAVGFVALSRSVEFQPPVIYGFIASCAFLTPSGLDRSRAGKAVLYPALILLGVSVGAWALLTPVRDLMKHHDAWGLVQLEEVLALLAVAGMEGLVFRLIPLKFMDGAKLFDWSRTRWFALYLVMLVLLACGILNPEAKRLDALQQTPMIVACSLVASYLAVSALTWAFFWRMQRVPAGAHASAGS